MSDIRARQDRLRDFAQERDWEQFHTPKNLVMALAGEVGELLDIFQWLTPEDSQALPEEVRTHVRTEIADVTIYLLRLADVLGIDLLSSVDEVMDANERRFPADEVRGSARKRTGGGE